jgi:hypothetical protein
MSDSNNDKNVYILGAGFSKEIGLPLQDDFLLVAKEVYFKSPDIYKYFEKVFDYQDELTKMKKYLNYPLLNLEQLFNLIEMDDFYSQSEKLREIKKLFINLICDVLIDKTPCPFYHNSEGHLVADSNAYDNYVNFITLLIKSYRPQFSLHNDTIISFNYDLVLEGAATIYNSERVDGNRLYRDFFNFKTTFGKTNIVSEPVANFFNKKDKSFFPSNINIFSDNENSIKLLKLHGSINWKSDNKDGTFIVPPTWNKSDPQIRLLWQEACKELMDARRIIVIGYSFPETDIYVKSLLGLAINQNKILQNIYFINPDKDIAKKSSLSLLDKFFEKYCDYKEWKFSHFMDTPEGRKFIEDSLNRNPSFYSKASSAKIKSV